MIELGLTEKLILRMLSCEPGVVVFPLIPALGLSGSDSLSLRPACCAE